MEQIDLPAAYVRIRSIPTNFTPFRAVTFSNGIFHWLVYSDSNPYRTGTKIDCAHTNVHLNKLILKKFLIKIVFSTQFVMFLFVFEQSRVYETAKYAPNSQLCALADLDLGFN